MQLKLSDNQFGLTPISHSLIMDILKEYKRPNDKINEWVKNGELVTIRRGLYIPGPKSTLTAPEPFLIANHLRGPSYISLESALAYWGMIPEHVFEITSATIKTSKTYNSPPGRFSYLHLPSPYFSFGMESLSLSSKQTVLIASREKAICDKIILTPGITLRSIKQTKDFLLEDLRMDKSILRELNTSLIRSWIENAPKQSSVKMLIKTLNEL